MKPIVHEIDVSTPTTVTKRGIGWSKVVIHLNDETVGVLPLVTMNVHVPYDEAVNSVRSTRELALEQAKHILKESIRILDGMSLQEVDATKR